MRRLALFVVLLTAACSAGASAKPPASPSPAVSASAAAQPSPAPSASPLQIPTGELLYAVFEPQSGPANKVAIAGLDGVARAKASFTPVTLPYVGCAGAVPPVQAYTLGNRVYFLDGGGVVRYLDTQGNVIEVTSFPHTAAQQEVSFAVSPDGRRLLGTVLNLPPKPASTACQGGTEFAPGDFSLDIYAADAGGPSKQISHQSFPQSGALQSILSFIGWDAAGPLATDPTAIGTQGGGPTHYWGHAVRTDLSGKVTGDLGGTGCNAMDDLLDGTVACALESSTSVRKADGTEIWRASQQLLGGLLSPDGKRVVGFGDQGEVAVTSDGSVASLAGEFFVTGWLDNVTLIGNFPTGEIGIQKIAPVSTGRGQGYKATFVGVVQRP